MVNVAYPPDFTIAYLVHGDIPLLDVVIPTTINALCGRTRESYDLLLVVDGAQTAPVSELLDRAYGKWGFDEVRLRRRERHHAPGDKTNNGHAHLVAAEQSEYLIVVEGDVVAFRTDPEADILHTIANTFDRCPELAVAQRIDDHDEWQWSLADVGPPFSASVRSVNRVSTHFLVYHLPRFAQVTRTVGKVPWESFYDDGHDRWYNYEDWLSGAFARPAGPGIGYLADIPLRVYHCDRKVAPGSAHYRRDLATRLAVFHERAAALAATGHDE